MSQDRVPPRRDPFEGKTAMPAALLRLRGSIVLVAVMAFLASGQAVGATEFIKPVAAYIGEDASIIVATANGPLRTLPPLDTFSIDGGIVVGSGTGTVAAFSGLHAYDAVTADELWHVKNAVHPIVTDGGKRVVFWPDGGGMRDPQVNSVWMRGRNGKVKKVVQFSNGGNLPGYDPGFEGEAGLLSTSVDNAGDTIVVAEGNDVDLFVYDVFAVDRVTKTVTRLTAGKESRWPSISPNGDLVVYQRDVDVCGGLAYVRAAKLVLVKPNGKGRRLLIGGSCDAWFSNARWIDNHTIVAYKTTYDGSDFRTKLYKINTNTGVAKRLVKAHDIVFFSAARGRVGYVRDSKPGWYLLDVAGGDRTRFGSGYIPHVAGDHNTI
jgi:hypothetical protein